MSDKSGKATEKSKEELSRELEGLLEEQRNLLLEAEETEQGYRAEFGDLLEQIREKKRESLRTKKTISYCRRRINHGLPVDPERMEPEIDEEMRKLSEREKRQPKGAGPGEDTDRETLLELVKDQIDEILTTEPYIYKEILKDQDKKTARRELLLSELDDCEDYQKLLSGLLFKVFCEAGLKNFTKA